MEGVGEEEAPGVREAVGEAEVVELPLRVEEGVLAPVPVGDAVGEGVGVAEPLFEGVALPL
jgi:hypothetical protein